MGFENDNRIVMTLDAGGTNFVFSAIRANQEITIPISLPSHGNDLQLCLSTILEGFQSIKSILPEKPVAISFAFPGPADYKKGIIGDLGNLPAFRGGIALGPMLENKFELPVFINNDGDLFAYGEAISGLLPYINEKLKSAGSPKQYKNLFGITLGTGFGGGIVHNGELYTGDNDAAAEIWLIRNKIHPSVFAEEGASIRAVQRVYLNKSNIKPGEPLSPKDIYEIAQGNKKGDQTAALESFRELGEVVGDALANGITLIDGIIVIGGGMSNAYKFFIYEIIKQLNGSINSLDGKVVSRLEMKAFNLDDENELGQFIFSKTMEITVPFSDKKMIYDPVKRIGIGISRLGTSKAVSIGAYAFALNKLQINN
jgi:glucokinase